MWEEETRLAESGARLFTKKCTKIFAISLKENKVSQRCSVRAESMEHNQWNERVNNWERMTNKSARSFLFAARESISPFPYCDKAMEFTHSPFHFHFRCALATPSARRLRKSAITLWKSSKNQVRLFPLAFHRTFFSTSPVRRCIGHTRTHSSMNLFLSGLLFLECAPFAISRRVSISIVRRFSQLFCSVCRPFLALCAGRARAAANNWRVLYSITSESLHEFYDQCGQESKRYALKLIKLFTLRKRQWPANESVPFCFASAGR